LAQTDRDERRTWSVSEYFSYTGKLLLNSKNLHDGGKRLLINLKLRMPRDFLPFLIARI
jgi:hypothetical protein